jgi:hypothetical protein
MKNTSLSRRAFLASTTLASSAGIVGCTTSASRAPIVTKQFSPNERVRVGLIGLGGRCRDIVKTCLTIPEMEVVAVCDCFAPRVDDFIKKMGKDQNWKAYTDFRMMIEKENLDGVMVETTTHARAWVTCHAMAMGMDAYIEKPMSLTIAEGREMVDMARKYDRITQVGTQQRSMPLNNWASDLVKNGHIGKVLAVRAPNFVGPLPWSPQPGEKMPEGGSDEWWDIWMNQTEVRPYHSQLHRGWAKWWDYDGGGTSFGVTGWGAHSYDQIQRGLGTDETGPVEIVLQEEVKDRRSGEHKERTPGPGETGARYYAMTKNVAGPRAKVAMKFENGTELQLDLDADYGPGLGCIFVGEKGTIEINRDKISGDPLHLVAGDDRPKKLDVLETQPHIKNWLDGIKTRATCTADIEYGQRASTLCYLVNIARDLGKVGETLQWDPKKERFKNSSAGNAMLSRPRRKGYELPS